VTYVYPEDRPRRPRIHWRGLSRSAQVALALGGLYLLQVLVSLASSTGRVDAWIVKTFGLTANPLEWKAAYQILTYALVHSFDDPLHVVLNAVLLFFCGSVIESERGPRTMFSIFLLGVVGGGLAFTALEVARDGPSWPLIGASAGCYALLAGAAVIHPNLETFFRIPLWVIAAVYVAIDALRFATSLKTGSVSVVSYVAHLGGAATGLVLALRGISDARIERLAIFRWKERWQDHRRRRNAERDASRARKLDAILEKIHREGIGALTSSERAFLNEASSALKGTPLQRRETVTAWMGSDEKG
jgi:membrane associated rhomboid family serine protease